MTYMRGDVSVASLVFNGGEARDKKGLTTATSRCVGATHLSTPKKEHMRFTEPEGLVAQIERGLDIDEVQVQMKEAALRRLRTAWEKKDLVPKQDVGLLWNVGNGVPRLEKCLLLYPQRAGEISKFLMND